MDQNYITESFDSRISFRDREECKRVVKLLNKKVPSDGKPWTVCKDYYSWSPACLPSTGPLTFATRIPN